MRKTIEFPHTVCRYTCMVNGLRDVYQWKTGQMLPDEFMLITSGFASFVYLKIRDLSRLLWCFGVRT